MTAGQFGEVDLDMLADFVGGALEGTPDEAAVARLIADDPTWARAHAALAPAVARTQESLAGWGARPEPMPPDVADRLSTALAEAGALAETGALVAGAGESSATPPAPSGRPGRRLTAVPGGDRAGSGKPARRRWSRWAGPVAVAAAVAAFGGIGLSQLVSGGMAQDNGGPASRADNGSAPQMATASGAPESLAAPSTDRLLATGTNYARASLIETMTALGLRTSRAAKSGEADAGGMSDRLQRLADRAALAACLAAVTSAHNRGPIVVDFVDYASFEGSPAIVISFVDQGGERWAWVAGPACGQPQSGADTRYGTRVG